MEYYKFIELQLTKYDGSKSLRERTNGLLTFAKLFLVRLHLVEDGVGDTFLIELPSDEYIGCRIMNALFAYCEIHHVVHRIYAEKPDVPFSEVLNFFSSH
jgi:hypothetical protein